ncbi:MAG: hypothetical protein P8J32_06250, partial [bacterium]|nr:hypothetical protein [bacterium]
LSSRVVIILIALITLMVLGGPKLEGCRTPVRNFAQTQDAWPEECDKTRTWLTLAQDEHKQNQTTPNTRQALLERVDAQPWCVTTAEIGNVVHDMHELWAESLRMRARANPCSITVLDYEAWRDFRPQVKLVGRVHTHRILMEKQRKPYEDGFKYLLGACSDDPDRLVSAMVGAQAAANTVEHKRLVRRFYRLHYEGAFTASEATRSFMTAYPLRTLDKVDAFADWYLSQGVNNDLPLPKKFVDEQKIPYAYLTVVIKKHWHRQGGVKAQVTMAEAYINAGYDEDAIRRSLVYQLTRLGYYKTAYEQAQDHAEGGQLTKHVLKERHKTAEKTGDYETVVTQWGTTTTGRVILKDTPHN